MTKPTFQSASQESKPNSKNLSNDPKWYAVYTRSRFEKKIYKDFLKAKQQVFLPLIKEKRAWSDRLKTILVPLLPSYVFVKLAPQNLHQVYHFPGVVRLVSFEGKPCEIKETEITLMEKIVQGGFNVQSTTQCGVGDWVRIINGPLTGWEGKVEGLRGQSRIVFHLECIQQALSVEIDMGDVQKLKIA